jgi:hypothetical protein
LGSSYQAKPKSFIQALRVENNRGWLFYLVPQRFNKKCYFLSKHALIGSTPNFEMLIGRRLIVCL